MKDLLPWRRREEGLVPERRKSQAVDLLHRRMDDLFEDFFEGFEELFSAGPLMRRVFGTSFRASASSRRRGLVSASIANTASRSAGTAMRSNSPTGGKRLGTMR